MPLFVIMKTINEREDQGESCNEVVGLYAGALKVEQSSRESLESAAEKWIIEYLKFLDPNHKFAFKEVHSGDPDVVLTYNLLEDPEDSSESFETIYVYPLKLSMCIR